MLWGELLLGQPARAVERNPFRSLRCLERRRCCVAIASILRTSHGQAASARYTQLDAYVFHPLEQFDQLRQFHGVRIAQIEAFKRRASVPAGFVIERCKNAGHNVIYMV